MERKRITIQKNDKKTVNINIAMSILFIVVLSFISLGYAAYGQLANISGSSTFGQQGDIEITNVTLTSSKNVTDDSIPTYTQDSIDFHLTFKKEQGSPYEDYQAIYSITIENNTFYDYDYNMQSFAPTITNSSDEPVDPSFLTYHITGIDPGDSIPAGESVTFTLQFDFAPDVDDTYGVSGNMNTELEEQPHGSVLGSIPNNSQADLRESQNNDLAPITVTVINSYQSPRTFTLGISDTTRFSLADSSGNALNSFTLEGGVTQDYIVYIKRVANAIYSQEYFNTNITLSYGDVINSNCGGVTIRVDEEIVVDTTPPVVSNITVTTNDATSETTTDQNVGSVTLNWDASDPETEITQFYVIVYKDGTQLGDVRDTTGNTNPNNPQLTITGLADGNYYFKVYGENAKQIKPTPEQINSCDSSYCTKTTSAQLKWHFTISLLNATNVKSISPTAVNRGKSIQTTITPDTYEQSSGCSTTTETYVLSQNITVKMGETTISSGNTAGHYVYTRANNNKSATLNLYGVTGDITVTVTGSKS